MNICRICETIDNLLCSLNDPVNGSIVEMLTDLANVSYSNDDQLPKLLCQKCQKSLQFAIEFKRQCEMTDLKLRLSLKLLRAEEETEDVKYFTSNNEEFPNYAVDNYDTVSIKIEKLEEEIIDVGITVKEEDIFLLQESTELVDQNERINRIQSSAVFFESISALKSHTTDKPKQQKEDRNESHHDPILTCFYCSKLCSSSIHLERHVRKEHCSTEIRTFQCFDCKNEFKNRHIFRVHYENSHSGKSYGCHLCSKRYLSKSSLNQHLRSFHDGLKNHQCNICHKRFMQKYFLDQHLVTHSEDRPFRCSLCKFSTKTLISLKKHTANKHTIDPKKHRIRDSLKLITTCEYCGEQMSMKKYYAHIRNHTSAAKAYKCEICPKSFITNGALRNHAYVHTGEYPYNCNICDRKFSQQQNLKRHTFIHTGEKPHQCTFCSQAFAQRGNLTAHIRLHTGETPYHCSECSNRYGSLKTLKIHKKKYHTK